MSHVWAVGGEIPHRIDHAGLAGAGVGLALSGALAALVVTTDTSLGNTVGWFIWLVLYPLSPLIGYDLATRRAGATEEPLLLAGGYAVAVAAAHLAMAAGIAVCSALDLDSHSPIWMVLVAFCVVVVAPARAVALRAGRGLRGAGWALIGVTALVLLGAWLLLRRLGLLVRPHRLVTVARLRGRPLGLPSELAGYALLLGRLIGED